MQSYIDQCERQSSFLQCMGFHIGSHCHSPLSDRVMLVAKWVHLTLITALPARFCWLQSVAIYDIIIGLCNALNGAKTNEWALPGHHKDGLLRFHSLQYLRTGVEIRSRIDLLVWTHPKGLQSIHWPQYYELRLRTITTSPLFCTTSQHPYPLLT